MNFSARILQTLAVLVALALAGCSGRAINPGTGIVDVKVWVVLSANDFEIGDRSNLGCRLTEQEVRDRIGALQQSGAIFGGNTTFRWSPADIELIFDPTIFDRENQRIEDWISWAHYSAFAPTNVVNIWFAGNLQPTGASNVWAGTLDPQAASQVDPLPAGPWIVINDGGFTRTFGFVPPPSNGSPAAVTGYNIIQHEMDHYLGRFTSRVFTATGSQYDSGEHDAAPPLNMRNNVLRSGGVDGTTAPYPLVIPSASQGVSERQEVWQRIRTGQWNNP